MEAVRAQRPQRLLLVLEGGGRHHRPRSLRWPASTPDL